MQSLIISRVNTSRDIPAECGIGINSRATQMMRETDLRKAALFHRNLRCTRCALISKHLRLHKQDASSRDLILRSDLSSSKGREGLHHARLAAP